VLKLTYSNLEFQNFPGEDPQTPLFKGRGGRGGEGEGGEREGKEGGEGKGRDRGGKEGRNGGGGEGRGGALDMGSASPRDKLWIRPLRLGGCLHDIVYAYAR